MKRMGGILVVVCLGILSFFIGYKSVPNAGKISEEINLQEETGGYFARAEKEWLIIYDLESQEIFEYTKLQDLQLEDTVKKQLLRGITFENEKEVYDFLENCMS